jgi:hypothetical protein
VIIIKSLSCKGISALVYIVTEVYENRDIEEHEFDCMQFIAKYDDAKEIIYELVHAGYHLVFADGFGAPEWDDYDGEYVVTLSCDGIWVEPAKREDRYYTVEGLTIFVMDNCSHKILPYLESNLIYEVNIDDEEFEKIYDDCDHDCDLDCDDCDLDCDCCDCHGCEPYKEESVSYKVNGKPAGKKEFLEAIDEMDNDYLDNVRDMLLRYKELQDKMDAWRKIAYYL